MKNVLVLICLLVSGLATAAEEVRHVKLSDFVKPAVACPCACPCETGIACTCGAACECAKCPGHLNYYQGMQQAEAADRQLVVWVGTKPDSRRFGNYAAAIHCVVPDGWQGVKGPAVVISHRREWLRTFKLFDGGMEQVWPLPPASAVPNRARSVRSASC